MSPTSSICGRLGKIANPLEMVFHFGFVESAKQYANPLIECDMKATSEEPVISPLDEYVGMCATPTVFIPAVSLMEPRLLHDFPPSRVR